MVGGGASGLIAAIKAAERQEVILIEGNDKCGKKLLLTGNGKCNYWNRNICVENYNQEAKDFLNIILSKENQKEVFTFLEQLGIYPKIKDDYYYPNSNQATSIRTLLMKELERRKVTIYYQFKVEEIQKQNNQFLIKSKDRTIIGDKVILATGSCAYPKTGSDGSSYQLASKLGHSIHPLTPALVPLVSNDKGIKEWDGIRCDAKIFVWIENQMQKEEQGEIQLTNYGISGICTLNISSIVTRNLKANKKVMVHINFLPDLKISCYQFLTERNQKLPNDTIEELLESVFAYPLLFVLLKKAQIKKEDHWSNLSEKQKSQLANIIQCFPLEIVDSLSFDRSQVTSGGVPLEEINPQTMESMITPNLYLTGELLDVDGKCGGFNLAFAWISGYLAGKEI